MTSHNSVSFADYFQRLHGYAPYPWQQDLAEQSAAGVWPGAIDLPTGSGKTACLDIALFSLAHQADLPVSQRSAPRRIFFCVNRRVIVDEAYVRARQIAQKIWEAERKGSPDDVLHAVARRLRSVAGSDAEASTPPVDVLEVRGGIYRDNRWARSITQPTIVCTTLDQLGSRLLFRGFGVSQGAAPVQAALIAYDSLVFLDEAHISEPFRQTLENVQRFLDPARWAEQALAARPLTVVPMTATPNAEMKARGVVRITSNDRAVTALNARLSASKPAQLEEVKDVAKAVVDAARRFTSGPPRAIGIMVNRVATARAIYDQLRLWRSEPNDKKRGVPADLPIELVIGSMRPIDRDRQSERLNQLLGPGRPRPASLVSSIVVATQCLEVGADYDFDVLITECASLDSLRQRFGRLNRGGRGIDSEAVVFVQSKDVKPEGKLDDEKPHDPIYGNALSRTWNWLNEHSTDQSIDFGIDAFNRLLSKDNNAIPANLLSPTASLNSPSLLPAYLDLLCQTSPQPALNPDVSLFIHGPGAGQPDVQVCWRGDLIEDDQMTRDDWANVVGLLPPTAAECARVPISRFKSWLGREVCQANADTGDALAVLSDQDDKPPTRTRASDSDQGIRLALVWRGANERTCIVESPDQVLPGDTFVIPASSPDSAALTHIPNESCDDGQIVPDLAESAFALARDRAALRLHPTLVNRLPAVCRELLAVAVSEEPPDRLAWSIGLKSAAEAIRNHDSRLAVILNHLARSPLAIEAYPDARGVVLISKRPLGGDTQWHLPPIDDGDHDASRQPRVLLSDHGRHVVAQLREAVNRLPVDTFSESLTLAAKFHDIGKADERFQAMLRRTDRTDAWLMAANPESLLAKSSEIAQTMAQAGEARLRAGLPQGFRHELLSVQLVSHFESTLGLPPDVNARDLVLHLIATHHGHGRPFAPVVVDDELPEVRFVHREHVLELSPEERSRMIPSHRIDSGVAERFWRCTRRYGWWGIAYLESILRLADQQASAAESQATVRSKPVPEPAESAS